MKVLLVNKFLYPNGGSETYIFDLGKQLEALGHEVQYFGMEDERNVVGNTANSYTDNMDFHERSLNRLLYPFQIVYSIEARKKIKRVLVDFQPDIVHLNNFNFQLTPSIIYEIRRFQLPIVYTAHDYQLICPNHMCLDIGAGETCEKCIRENYWQCTKRKCIHASFMKSFLGTIEAELYKRLKTYQLISLIVCPSVFLKKMLDTRADLCEKTVVMHNFMTQNKYKPEVVREDAKKYVLYFGRYEKEKGVKTLIEVCRKLPTIDFRFAGKGPLSEEIASLPNAMDYGFLEKEELQRVIAEAAFSVCPSEWYENCPFSVMEAVTLGTPVIGADIGGISELIQNEVDGLLFESGNVADLQEKIEQLWNHEDMCQAYAHNCLLADFDSCQTYTEKLVQQYQRLMR